jgi:NAD(P)H-hydrate epimerase
MTEPLPNLPPRDRDAHKGDFGTALVIGGSRGMSGAVALAGMSALRGGAGLVRVAVPEVCLETVAAFESCYTTIPLPCDSEGRIASAALPIIRKESQKADVLALGPGLGRSSELEKLVGVLFAEIEKPMVVDADALNALAAQSGERTLDQHSGPRVLTPHPGEFARLIARKLDRDERQQAAVSLAAKSGCVILLKGHRTLITDGQRRALNDTGNPGMATGGAGDVLTGLVAALLCQHLTSYDAARLAAHLHGLAGDLAAQVRGEASLVARDLIEFLPLAFLREMRSTERPESSDR